MSRTKERIRLAVRMHERIRQSLKEVRATKIDAYLLLREFKRAKLYRWLDVAIAPGHAARISTERRFSTWQDYVNGLGRDGISVGYFNELERLDERYGERLVRLCAAGVPVRVRRILLRATGRAVDEVKEVLDSDAPDAGKLERIERAAEAWESQWLMSYPRWRGPLARARKYRRQTQRLQQMFSKLVDETAEVPPDYRRGEAYALMVLAWKQFFERHLEIGERLARLELTPELTSAHADRLHELRETWSLRRAPQAA